MSLTLVSCGSIVYSCTVAPVSFMHVAWRQCPGIEALTWKFACFLAFHFSQIFLNRPGSAMWNFCKVLKCFGSANWWNGARRFKTTVRIKCIFSPAGTIQRPVLARCLMGWMEAVLQWKSFSSIEFTCRAKPKRRTMDWPVLSNVAVFNPCLGRLPQSHDRTGWAWSMGWKSDGTKWHQIDSTGMSRKSREKEREKERARERERKRERERWRFVFFVWSEGDISLLAVSTALSSVQERQTKLHWRLRCAISIVAPRPQGVEEGMNPEAWGTSTGPKMV